MGQITIETTGSFPLKAAYIESALAGGHAAALGRAIEYLTQMLPEAIALDHQLQKLGEIPPDASFGMDVPSECEHGKAFVDYCEPCGRIHGGPG